MATQTRIPPVSPAGNFTLETEQLIQTRVDTLIGDRIDRLVTEQVA
jgi:hypothetical protein